MKRLYSYISQHLSLRMGLLILLAVGSMFGVSLGVMFFGSRKYVQQVAFNRASQALDQTVVDIDTILNNTETAAEATARLALTHINPDSLRAFSRRMCMENPVLQGVIIALAPGTLPQQGELFSVYSHRLGDSIETLSKAGYDYTVRPWYVQPSEQKGGRWLDPTLDQVPDIDAQPQYYCSYATPIQDATGRFYGVVSCNISLRRLSEAVTAVEAYPNSSAIMLDHEGRYIVHPDTLKLISETIFSDPDPRAMQEVVPLGQSMLAGHSGIWELVVDGQVAHIFYKYLKQPGWSVAIVCPDSDVFSSLSRLFYGVWMVIALALLWLLIFCYFIIRRATVPINNLAAAAQRISNGHFDETLPESKRADTIGQLQNSFVQMQKTLHSHISRLHQMNAETEQQIEELQQAYQLVTEADQRKTAFVQDIAHQIRTPLNIITGFTQVIASERDELTDEELCDIRQRMQSSAKALNRISRMLLAASNGSKQLSEQTSFSCKQLCREVVGDAREETEARIVCDCALDDDFALYTDRKAVRYILDELIDNACRFSSEGTITLGCRACDDAVCFTVSDTGPGINPEDRDRIFSLFTKLDNFTEGIGLGLPLCRQTAQLLGGDLCFDDSYAEGSRFILKLPYSSNQQK